MLQSYVVGEGTKSDKLALCRLAKLNVQHRLADKAISRTHARKLKRRSLNGSRKSLVRRELLFEFERSFVVLKG